MAGGVTVLVPVGGRLGHEGADAQVVGVLGEDGQLLIDDGELGPGPAQPVGDVDQLPFDPVPTAARRARSAPEHGPGSLCGTAAAAPARMVASVVQPPGPLVDAAWLASVTGRDDVVVADVRWRLGDPAAGRALHAAGHVPGAVFVDVDADLAGDPVRGPGRHPLPEPGAFAAALTRLGIGDDTTVVAYDDAGGSIAARLWWMLDATGRRCAVLDGGIATWAGPLQAGAVVPSPADPPATARPWPAERLADIADLGAADVVVDARAPERYRGEVEPVDPRAGHVPGAVNLPWSELVDERTGRFAEPARIAAAARARGIVEGVAVTAHCGSGVTACHLVLGLRVAGIEARLWPGSWSEWSSDPSRPVATGDEP